MMPVATFFLVHLLDLRDRLDGYQQQMLRRQWKRESDERLRALYAECEARLIASIGSSIWRDAVEGRCEP